MYPESGERTNTEMLWKLAKDKRVKSRVTAARSPDASRDILEFLVADEASAVRRTVAAWEGPEVADLLRTLGGDPDLKTRQAVVANPHCSADVLRELVNDPHESVRWAIPSHPRTDISVRRAITASQDSTLRRLLAESDELEPEIARLLMDDSPEIKESLAAHTTLPDVLSTLAAHPNPKVRAGAAQNPKTTPEQRHSLARDPAALVRANLLKFVELEEEELRLLANDRSVNVRWWLATCPTTPLGILENLAQDPHPEVASQATAALARW
ncbi:hypothetical protein [Nonomuraea sp. NPDC049750]|uniref:hypothetical protein n=1 Tax=Nonomuraea sp. NPDC049750 TaxID=3154738 RepID=UPI00340EF8F0